MEQSSALLLRLESSLGSVSPKNERLELVIGVTIHPREREGRSTSPQGRAEMEITEPRLHKISVVCERTSLSRSTVWREITAGRLKAIRVGKCLRVSEAELQRFIASMETASQ